MFPPRLVYACCLAALLPLACLRVPEDLEAPTDGRNAAPPNTAEEVLDDYVEAIGGEEPLRKLEQRTVESRIVFLPDEGCGSEEEDPGCIREKQTGTFILQTTADAHMYRRTVVGESVEERGFDGKQGWRLLGDGTVRLDASQDNVLTREDARLHWYLDPGKYGIEVTLVGSRREDSQGEARNLDGLKWRVGNVDDLAKVLWFDRATGLLHEEVIEQGEGEQEVRQVIRYSDYREVDGIKIPHAVSLVTTQGKRKRIVNFSIQRVSHKAVDASAFAIPQPENPGKQADPRRTALAQARDQAQGSQDAALWIAYARAAWNASEFDQAKTAAEKTLSFDAKEPEALWILVRLHILTGSYAEAQRLLGRAAKAGISDEQIARQRTWIHSHRRDFRRLADEMDTLGNAELAGRYRSFAGQPLQVDGRACQAIVPLAQGLPNPLVRLNLAGEEVVALIDSGATDLILSEGLSVSKDVAIQARSKLGPEGPDVAHGQLESLKLGEVSLKNVPVEVLPDAALQTMARGQKQSVQAVLGLRALESFQVTFDVPQQQLVLVPRTKACQAAAAEYRTGETVPFWLHETNFVYLHAAMNDEPGLYLLNTGMRGVAVTATREAYSHAGIMSPPIKEDEPPLVTVKRLSLTDEVGLDDASGAFGYFEQTQSTDGFAIDGMVGMELFGNRRWTIDFDRHAIYVAS